MGNIISSNCTTCLSADACFAIAPLDLSTDTHAQPAPPQLAAFNELIGVDDVVAAFNHVLGHSREK
jgi:hypothetical protein